MRVLLLVGTLSLLSSCTPAVYIDLFNATGDDIVITKDKSKAVVTIPRNASPGFTTFYLPGEHLTSRTPKHSWQYSFPQFRVPPSFY
jgi:hypothetical protein